MYHETNIDILYPLTNSTKKIESFLFFFLLNDFTRICKHFCIAYLLYKKRKYL